MEHLIIYKYTQKKASANTMKSNIPIQHLYLVNITKLKHLSSDSLIFINHYLSLLNNNST